MIFSNSHFIKKKLSISSQNNYIYNFLYDFKDIKQSYHRTVFFTLLKICSEAAATKVVYVFVNQQIFQKENIWFCGNKQLDVVNTAFLLFFILLLDKLFLFLHLKSKNNTIILLTSRSKDFFFKRIIKKKILFFETTEKRIILEEISRFVNSAEEYFEFQIERFELYSMMFLHSYLLLSAIPVCLKSISFSDKQIASVFFTVCLFLPHSLKFYNQCTKKISIGNKRINDASNKLFSLLFDQLSNINNIHTDGSFFEEIKYINERIKDNLLEEKKVLEIRNIREKMKMSFMIFFVFCVGILALNSNITILYTLFDVKDQDKTTFNLSFFREAGEMMKVTQNILRDGSLIESSEIPSEIKNFFKIYSKMEPKAITVEFLRNLEKQVTERFKDVKDLINRIGDSSMAILSVMAHLSVSNTKIEESKLDMDESISNLGFQQNDSDLVSLCTKDCDFTPEPEELINSNLIIKNVSCYKGEVTILDNINLTFYPGESYGIIGPSGSGKSSLSKVISGQWEFQGSITFGKYSLKNLNSCCWAKLISFIPQNSILYDRTIVNNIVNSFSPKNESLIVNNEIENAAHFAYADLFIKSLADNYKTKVGAGGEKLSGGQRQRVNIAKAFYKKGFLWLEDEATSALDMISEKNFTDHVQEEIIEKQNKIVLGICHRKSRLEKLDNIILIKQGEVIAQGSFSELSENNALFQEMFVTEKK